MNIGLITRYTGALYNAPEPCRPRYDEFRDMFSEGQLKSKLWLVSELSKRADLANESVAIAGSWFATLAFLILENQKNSKININCIDIDSRCSEFLHYLVKNDEKVLVKGVTADMHDYHYSEGVIINTSCEHLPDLNRWLALVPKGALVVLQSNNYFKDPSHVNCVKSLPEFREKTKAHVSETLFSGELDLGIYTRYMIIGRKQ